MTEPIVRVQLIWHMHQPPYGVPGRTLKALPWVRLHAIKSYYDMLRAVQEVPQARCTFNASGGLLEQLDAYVERDERDMWWMLTLRPAAELDDQERRHLVEHFFSLPWDTCVRPYPRYAELLEKREAQEALDPSAFTIAELRDLQVWFNLAWFGFAARHERGVVQALIDKGRGFTEGEKVALMEQQMEVMRLLLPLLEDLVIREQIEVSASPMYHPVLPLLIDAAASGRDDLPDMQAREDARWHIARGRAWVTGVAGLEPRGMWPPEGALSEDALALMAEEEIEWTASDELVLAKALADTGGSYEPTRHLYRPWRVQGQGPLVWFRDSALSAQIAEGYVGWPADEAAADVLDRLRAIADAWSGDGAPVVTLVINGEAPWERFEDAGEAFLYGLLRALADAPDVELALPSELLDDLEVDDAPIASLAALPAGSWYGDLSPWCDCEEKRQAWALIHQARQVLTANHRHKRAPTARRALHRAQASDWLWWYGESLPTAQSAEFDRLFRDQIRAVFLALGQEIPEALDMPLFGHGDAVVFEPPRQLIHPTIDGISEYFYEWLGAGVYHYEGTRGLMIDRAQIVRAIHVGFDLEQLYIRAVLNPPLDDQRERAYQLRLIAPTGAYRLEAWASEGGRGRLTSPEGQTSRVERVALGAELEIAVPFRALLAQPGDPIEVRLAVTHEGDELERHPIGGHIIITVPDETFDAQHWVV